MIYGLVASSEQTFSPSPAQFSGIASFDFIRGIYNFGETSLAAGDIVDQTGWIGASGLEVPTAGYGAELLYAPLNTFLGGCDFTIVADFETINPSDYPDLITIAEPISTNYIEMAIWVASGSSGECDFMTGAGGISQHVYYNQDTSPGVHRIAFTRDNSHVAVSLDGGTVQSSSESFTLPAVGNDMTDFYLGGWVAIGTYPINIRSIDFYNKKDDSELATLSA